MRLIEVKNNRIIIELDQNEQLVINNALNEVCHGVKINGFESRLGMPQEYVKSVLKAFNRYLDWEDGEELYEM